MLDMQDILKELRQLKRLKELLFTKAQLIKLDENYKKVINPFTQYMQAKNKLSEAERKMADTYIESDSDPGANFTMDMYNFTMKMYKDFSVDHIAENSLKQQIIMWKENTKFISRLDNLLRINMYDKSVLHTEEIKTEKRLHKQVSGKINPQLQIIMQAQKNETCAKHKLVKPLHQRIHEERKRNNTSKNSTKIELSKKYKKI